MSHLGDFLPRPSPFPEPAEILTEREFFRYSAQYLGISGFWSGAPSDHLPGIAGGKHADREGNTVMSMTRAHRLETQAHWQLQILFIGFLFLYISLVAVLYIIKKHEFTPFEEVKDNYLQINPFEGNIIKSRFHDLQGKGVVIKLNTMCSSLIQQSPEFSYLDYSQNILGDLCAKKPSEVNFVAYIKYEKQLINQPQKNNKVIYQLAKKVAVINWATKELVAQRTFTKNYTFSKGYSGKDSDVDRKLCIVSEEPSDEEVKRWIDSLALGDYYYY
jgi:hypothetical protein